MIKAAFGLALLGFVLFQAYVRLAPLPLTSFPVTDDRIEPGDYSVPGGIHIVRAVDDYDVQAKLLDVITASPRTRQIQPDRGAKFVVRSKFWGFPDVVQVWQENGLLHVQSHLVFGLSDLGVNRKRVHAWLDQIGV